MVVEEIKKIYSRYSKVYDLLFKNISYPRIKHAVTMMNIQPGEKILEIGVGTGFSLSLYPSHCQVIGIDLSPEMLEEARKKAKKLSLFHVDLREMDASCLEFPDNYFDWVVAAFVITVVPDPVKVIAEMKRVTKKEGKLLIINHFKNHNKFLGKIEEMISPLCEKMGWRSDLSLEELIEKANLKVSYQYKLNKIDLWKIVFAENNK